MGESVIIATKGGIGKAKTKKHRFLSLVSLNLFLNRRPPKFIDFTLSFFLLLNKKLHQKPNLL